MVMGHNSKACIWSSDTQTWTIPEIITSTGSQERGAPFFLNGQLLYFAGQDNGAVYQFDDDLAAPSFTRKDDSTGTIDKSLDELIKIDFALI